MIPDGLPDFLWLPGFLCVDGAYLTLKVGYLCHHIGDEVSFSEQGGSVEPFPPLAIQAELTSQVGGDCADALDLVVHGAESLLEDDALQVLNPALQGPLQVVLVEVLRVYELGAEDVFPALQNTAKVLFVSIADSNEERQELPVIIAFLPWVRQWEVALDVLHVLDQNPAGEVVNEALLIPP